LHTILSNLTVLIDDHILILDPGGFDVLQGLGGTLDALLEGIVEALGGSGFDLGDSGD
jgi:hypothetical protein